MYPPPPFRQLFLVSLEYSIIQADDMLPLVMLEKLQRNTSNEEHKIIISARSLSDESSLTYS